MNLNHLKPLVLEIIENIKQDQIEKTTKVKSGIQYDLYKIQITKNNVDYNLLIVIWLGKNISEIRVINYIDRLFDHDFKFKIQSELEEFLRLKLL